MIFFSVVATVVAMATLRGDWGIWYKAELEERLSELPFLTSNLWKGFAAYQREATGPDKHRFHITHGLGVAECQVQTGYRLSLGTKP